MSRQQGQGNSPKPYGDTGRTSGEYCLKSYFPRHRSFNVLGEDLPGLRITFDLHHVENFCGYACLYLKLES
eukprot:scaffold1321_cov402-Prasinococcus_capsulatus_cf.AAC.5